LAKGFVKTRRKLSWPLIGLLVVLHVAALYGLAKLLVPEFTASVERNVTSVFTVTITAPPDENEPEPDEGAQGDPGKDATPSEVIAPEPAVPVKTPEPLPQASSTGAAADSGAKQDGDGTGAAGEGPGTGSGNEGGGRGGVAITKPVHISGAISNARDYPTPEGGRNARRGTEVIVRVIVGVDGRARNCTIYRPSPDPEADTLTCQLVEQRLGFRPAQDRNGNPVAAPFYWRQRWF